MPKVKDVSKYKFRDISVGLQWLRQFLLGRKHLNHCRFPPLLSARTLPPPDIPRGPDDRYNEKYYYIRSFRQSVKPPFSTTSSVINKEVKFSSPPTPGQAWWFDGHCYYEYAESPRPKPKPMPKPIPKKAEKIDPCLPRPKPTEPCSRPQVKVTKCTPKK